MVMSCTCWIADLFGKWKKGSAGAGEIRRRCCWWVAKWRKEPAGAGGVRRHCYWWLL